MTRILADIRNSLQETERHSRSKFLGIGQSAQGRHPKNWPQMTGHPATVLKEYEEWEKVAERAGFKTWKAMYDQFCDDVVKGSRLEDFMTIWSNAWDFKAIRSAALGGEDALHFCLLGP